jgi:hypothetical protein
MDFSGQYLTYNEYQTLGGTLDLMPFNLFELEARVNIDRETQKRLVGLQRQPLEVKNCVMHLVDGFAFDGNYKDANSEEKTKYINRIIYHDLTGVVVDGQNILYRGI